MLTKEFKQFQGVPIMAEDIRESVLDIVSEIIRLGSDDGDFLIDLISLKEKVDYIVWIRDIPEYEEEIVCEDLGEAINSFIPGLILAVGKDGDWEHKAYGDTVPELKDFCVNPRMSQLKAYVDTWYVQVMPDNSIGL